MFGHEGKEKRERVATLKLYVDGRTVVAYLNPLSQKLILVADRAVAEKSDVDEIKDTAYATQYGLEDSATPTVTLHGGTSVLLSAPLLQLERYSPDKQRNAVRTYNEKWKEGADNPEGMYFIFLKTDIIVGFQDAAGTAHTIVSNYSDANIKRVAHELSKAVSVERKLLQTDLLSIRAQIRTECGTQQVNDAAGVRLVTCHGPIALLLNAAIRNIKLHAPVKRILS